MKFSGELRWKMCGIIRIILNLNLKLKVFSLYRTRKKPDFSLTPSYLSPQIFLLLCSILSSFLFFLPSVYHNHLCDVLVVLTGVFYHKLHLWSKAHSRKLLKPPSDGDNRL